MWGLKASLASLAVCVLVTLTVYQLFIFQSADVSYCQSSADHCTLPPGSQSQISSENGQKFFNAEAIHGSATSGSLFTGEVERSFPPSETLFHDSKWFRTAMTQEVSDANRCEKWSVVTTVFKLSIAVKVQSSSLSDDWCMVIVYDKKTPENLESGTNLSRIVHLTVKRQEEMGANNIFIRSLPWNHFGRKNIGYLYAISQGARLIWDMDDDNILKGKEAFLRLFPKDGVVARVAASNDFASYNPYTQFQPPFKPIWPRGFPLDHIKDERSWNSTLMMTKIPPSQIGVVQSLADNDPDVDAIYRLTMPIPFNFKAASDTTPVALPPKTFAPLNAQACLYTYKAFWMLLLPITTHGRVSDIWRGYTGQRLLWDLELRVLFASPVVNQFRNPHNYLADFNAELPLYAKSTTLLNFLRTWRPTQSTLVGRIEELSIELYKRKFLEIDDVYLSQKWLQSLLDAGYDFPALSLDCDSLDGLELMLPVGATQDIVAEAANIFMPSFEFFFPPSTKLVVLMDAEDPKVNELSRRVLDLRPNNTRLVLENPPFDIPIFGHHRQQYLMFYADRYISAEYVGFVDSDSIFVARVTRQDLFSGSKPRMVVTYGPPYNVYWRRSAYSTYWMLGKLEPFKAMNNFPVIVKTAHLKLIRDYISKRHDTDFDSVFRQIVKTKQRRFFPYSQFSIMAAYLWYFHRDEYDWDITEEVVGWKGEVVDGQVLTPEAAGFPPGQFQHVMPRISEHFTYAKPPLNYSEVLKIGYCYSRGSTQLNPPYCRSINVSNPNLHEWRFEYSHYYDRPYVAAAHMRRMERNMQCSPHPWSSTKVRQLFGAE